MKIILDRDDIEVLILKHVQSLGIKCNHVGWEGYSFPRNAEVTFDEPEVDADEHTLLQVPG